MICRGPAFSWAHGCRSRLPYPVVANFPTHEEIAALLRESAWTPGRGRRAAGSGRARRVSAAVAAARVPADAARRLRGAVVRSGARLGRDLRRDQSAARSGGSPHERARSLPARRHAATRAHRRSRCLFFAPLARRLLSLLWARLASGQARESRRADRPARAAARRSSLPQADGPRPDAAGGPVSARTSPVDVPRARVPGSFLKGKWTLCTWGPAAARPAAARISTTRGRCAPRSCETASACSACSSPRAIAATWSFCARSSRISSRCGRAPPLPRSLTAILEHAGHRARRLPTASISSILWAT